MWFLVVVFIWFLGRHLFQYTDHKVRTYKEYHSVCPSSELGLSQPLSRQRVFPSPQKQGGGCTLACGWGVGGSPNSDEGHTLWYSLYVRTLWHRLKNGWGFLSSSILIFLFEAGNEKDHTTLRLSCKDDQRLINFSIIIYLNGYFQEELPMSVSPYRK